MPTVKMGSLVTVKPGRYRLAQYDHAPFLSRWSEADRSIRFIEEVRGVTLFVILEGTYSWFVFVRYMPEDQSVPGNGIIIAEESSLEQYHDKEFTDQIRRLS